MRKLTLLITMLFLSLGAMAQLEDGKIYRFMDNASGGYLNAANYGTHITGAYGGVTVAALNEKSHDMLFVAKKSGDGFKLQTLTGYYLNGQEWNVDANSTTDGMELLFEEVIGGYKIKWVSTAQKYSGQIKYFKVEYVNGTYYPFCDAASGGAATWTIVERSNYVHNENSINRNDRKLNSFTITDGNGNNSLGVSEIQTSSTAPVYIDKSTTHKLTTYPGATLSFSAFSYTGNWMHAYAYVDYNKNYYFEPVNNNDGTTDGEIVSYNYYNGSTITGVTQNNGNAMSAVFNGSRTLPAFTLPADLAPGEYRMRVKVDWNNIDADYGDVTTNNTSNIDGIAHNGGCQCDIILEVKNFVATVGDVKYYDFNEAFAAVGENSVITLYANTEVTKVFPAGVTVNRAEGVSAPNVNVAVAKVGETLYATLAEAVEAARTAVAETKQVQAITLLANYDGAAIELPIGVSLELNEGVSAPTNVTVKQPTCVYNFVYNGNVKATQEDDVALGEEYPAIDANKLPYGVSATKPDGVVELKDVVDGTVTKSIDVTISLPFEFADDEESIDAWYYMTINSNTKSYLYNNGTANVLVANKNIVDDADRDAYTWAFIGNAFDGFVVKNKKAGYLNAGDKGAVIGENSNIFTVTKSSHADNGFFMAGEGKNCFNRNGSNYSVTYWNQTDAGSTFLVTPRDFEAELQTLIDNATALLGNLGEGTTVGYVTEDSRTAIRSAIVAAQAALSNGNVNDKAAAEADLQAAMNSEFNTNQPVADKYYTIVSKHNGYATNGLIGVDANGNALIWNTDNNVSKWFKFVADAEGKLYLYNVKTGKYLSSNGVHQSGQVSIAATAIADAKAVTITNMGKDNIVKIVPVGGAMIHADKNKIVVAYDNNNYTSASAWTIVEVENPGVAFIGDTNYETLAAAVAAWQSGQTITLLANTDEVVVLPYGMTIDDINRNGFTADNVTETLPVAQIGETKYETFAAALTAAQAMTGDVTVEILDKVTFNQEMADLSGSYNSIKFVGKAVNANARTASAPEIYLNVQGYVNAAGKKVAFENLKLSKVAADYAYDAGFMNLAFGVYGVTEATYTNCTFVNGAYASTGNVAFTGCTFKRSHDRYGLWAYGNATITVDACTFDDLRGIKMYSEDQVNKENAPVLIVKNTKFDYEHTKAAIVLTHGQSVTLQNNTYDEGNAMLELDLDGNPNGTPVTSDVAPVCVNDNGACGVLVDGKIYTTVAQAAGVATSGSNVTLLHNSTETVEFAYGVDLNKNGFEAAGVTVAQPVAQIGEQKYVSLDAAIGAAQPGDEVVVIANIADVTVDVTKNLTISGAATLNNVGINANGADALTVKGLTFTGNSWINSGTAEALTVSGVTATVAPVNTSYTNSRSAFISLGRNEGQELALTVENSNITVTTAGADAILGWAAITKATITGNVIKGSNDGYFTNADAIKFMAIANGAEFEIENNEIYSNYNGIVFAQNTTRDNAYSVSADANKFYGGADHIWIEITGGNTVHATVNATSANTVNGNAFTVDDIKYHSAVIKNWSSYAGVDVVTNENGKVIGGTLAAFNAESVAEGYEVGTNGAVVKASVAEVNGVKYASFAEAAAAAQADDEIVMLADATLDAETTLPAGVTLNGNGKQINGTIYAGGDLTFKGHTKVTAFSASYYDRVITIGEGACLEVTGTGRVSLGYGNTFNITGSIENAKDADKATVLPSLIIPGGISITGGNDAVMNVTNAYVKIGSTSSKNSAANGTFSVNFTNSIAEFTNQFTLAEPTSGKNPTFNVNITNSVFTTATKLCIAAPNSNVVVDNSVVTLATYFRNSGKFDIVNGSVFTGKTIQFGENGGNNGTITVDASSLTVTANSKDHAFDGKGVGKVVLKNEGTATLDYIKDMAIETVDGYEVVKEGNTYKAVEKAPVVKIGEQGYASIAEAVAAAKAANLTDVVITIVGENTAATADNLGLYDETAFNNVTIKQNNGGEPYYFDKIHTGKRAVADGQFVFDGVNIVITGQYINQCKTVLKNNSRVKRSSDAKNFIMGEMIVEAGSKFVSQIDAIYAGSLTIDGGRTDGNYNTEADYQTVFFDTYFPFVIKNGAYVLINAANENGSANLISGTTTVQASKVDVFNSIAINENATLVLDAKSIVTAKAVTGAGKITIDATGMDAGDVVNLTADLSKFTGTFTVKNNDKLEAKIVDGKIVLVAKEITVATLAELQAALAGDNNELPIIVTKTIEIPAGETVELNLNDKTVTATDNATGSYSMITNKGNLTINGEGTLQLTATNNRGWSAYSSVISNTVGGKLTVNGGTIQHLGGTSMAYAIDNLTNGKGTYAETEINGGEIKSTYRAIRQFLNGVEAQNILAVNGGTIESTGGNKAIWMQDPSKAANSGTLTIGANAVINSDVYLDVTAGSTEWPVTVSIATAALKNEAKIITENVPEGYICEDKNGIFGVELNPAYGKVAQIGNEYYATLQAAIEAVKDGETITLIDNVTVSVATAAYNDGTYIDGVRYTGDKSFTVDFNGKTVTDDGCVNDYLIYINNKGEKASEITFTNGTIVSKNGCWSAVCVNSSAATQNVVLNLNGMNITNSNDAEYSGNPVVRVRNLATVNVNDKTVITSNGASYGVAANTDGSTLNINEGATIVQQNSGTTGGNSVFAAVGGKGVINIKGGTITSDKYGVHTMTTGTPVINISGGTITAPVALKSSTNGGNGELATINVTGGTINGTLETYTENGKIVVSGGTFSKAVAQEYCAAGYVPAKKADGTYGVGVLPNAEVINLGNVTVGLGQEGVYGTESYYVYDLVGGSGLSEAEEPFDLQIAMNFKAKDTAEEAAANAFGNYTTDFFITMTGLANGSFDAAGCYLAGYYPSFNAWVKIPLDGFTVENETVYPVITSAGFDFKYTDICGEVKDFICGIYLTPEVLAANPGLNVELSLGLSENKDAALAADFVKVDSYVYDAEQLAPAVAQIVETKYNTLQAAIEAATEGATITMLRDVELAEAVTIPAGKEITLNLNGKTISQEKACTASYAMITNNGSLTITGEGKISFKDTSAGDPSFTWGSYTINNCGTLIVENGIIEHLGAQPFAKHMICAIFQYSGSTTINGGTISTPNYRSVRLWKGDMTINGGTFDGQLWVQAVDNSAKLTINGGTFAPNGGDGSSVFVGNVDNQDKLHNVEFTVTNGTFTTKIGCSNAAELAGEGIKGGKFTETAKNNTNSALLAEGFVFAGEAVDGYYGIEEKVELPEVEVIDIKGSLKDSDPDLTFALNFKIKDADQLSQEYLDKLFAQYGDWYTDYVLTISGLSQENVTFNANGDADGYLAGQYDAWSENWVSVPFENVTLANGESIYIMEYAAKLMNKDGLRFTLAEVAEIVQNFDCGVFFTPEFLAANPNMKVDLQLVVFTEDEQGVKTFYNDAPVASNNFEVKNFAAVVSGENKQSQYYATFAEAYAAAEAGETVELLADLTMKDILVINKAITLDGNGKTLTSTAGRAINVSGADGVTIKNLTINASGERAINVIQNATNVTIDNVTATAANYTVNIASSAPNAVVAIKNSTLNGLCTVNVSAAGAEVTVDNSTVNCNDNNTTAGEGYAALSLNREAVGGSIVATNTTVNVADGSDSLKGRNSAENGTVTINGSTEDVTVMVAVITYPGSTYYHGFASLAKAVEFAKEGDVITLIRDITVTETVAVEKAITIDLGGKKVTANCKKAFEVYADATIKNGAIEAAQRCVDTRKAVELTLESVTLVADNYTSTYGNPQPLTIGGSENGTKVVMTNVNISAAAGYGIITFVETELTATNSTIGGYNALYVKPGSDNSTFNFVDSDLSGSTGTNDVEGNSFSVIAVRANNVTVNVDDASTVTATGNYSYAISFKSSYQNEAATGSSVTVAGEITGNILADLNGNTVKVKADYADELAAAGYATSEADENGLVTVIEAVAKIGETPYATLAAAINAAENGETVTLLADVELASTLTVAGKAITLDLNGKTIDGTEKVRIAIKSYGDLTIKDSSAEKTGVVKAGIGTAGNAINICAGTFTLESGNIYSKNNALLIDEQAAVVNINGGKITAETATKNSAVMYISSTSETVVNITAGELVGYNGILLWNNTKLNITGGSINANGSTAIQGNGSKDNTEINISGGNLSGYYAAIYHPQGGELNISGGELTGWTGIVVKGGNVNISGGTIAGTGAADTYRPVSSGYVDTGDGLYVEHYDNSTNSENYGTPVVTVTGGTFTSANGKAVASYANTNNNVAALAGFISGGTYSCDVTELCAAGFVAKENADGTYGVVVDPAYGKVAKIGETFYATLAEAVAAAQNGDVVTLIANVELSATQNISKSITIDGNGNTITTAESVATSNHAAFYIDGESTLDVTIKNATFDGVKGSAVRSLEANVTIDNCVFQNGTHTGNQGVVRLTTGNATVKNSKFLNNTCPMVLSFNYDAGNENDELVVDNCQFEGNTVNGTAALYYVKGSNCTITDSEFVNNTVNCNSNGATIYLGFTENNVVTGNLFQNNTVTDASASTRVAGAIFFGYEANVSGNAFVNNTASNANGDVLGQVCTSTYYDCTIDLSKNYWGGEAPVYGKDYTVQHQTGEAEFALNSYYTDAECTNEVTLTYTAQVGKFGYASLQAAIDAAQTGETVVVLADIALDATVVVDNKTITLDLNGMTITGTDNNTSGNFYLINNNKGNLTIVDNSDEKTGKITLVATTERNWSASSVVVANNLGTVTVKGGTIEHLGGTSMAYGIDNLTNGANSVATLNIEGGKVASTYFAVRQFANGGTNNLNITGGNVGYAWMQSPNSNANVANISVTGGEVAGICFSGNNAVVELNAKADCVGEVYGTMPAGMVLVTVDGMYTFAPAVAKIGDVYYATLAEAVAAAENSATITLLDNVELASTLTVAGKTITLDLNGKTVSGTCNAGQSSLVYIENNAALTVVDSSDAKNGKLTYAQGSSNVGWTVDVKGAFTLEAGTVELTGESWSIGYAVDVRPNSWGTEYTKTSVFTMNGGNLVSSDGAVRVASSSAEGHKNVAASFVMNDGEIDAAWDGVFVQQSDAIYDVLSFTMNGGTIESDLNPVRVYGPAATGYVNGADCMNISFNGGTMRYTGTETREWVIDGILRVGGGSSMETILESGNITASEAFTEKAIADGYMWVANSNGTYSIAKAVAAIDDVYYTSLQAAVEAAKAGDNIELLADATVEGTLALPAGIELTSNGYTITGSIRMLGDLKLNDPLTITGGLWVGKSGETLTATLSGDKLTANYFMFQRGAYTINADIDAVYGYLSYEATFEVNSTIHTTGANGEVLYINGNVTLNDGAVLDSDNSVFVCNDNAVLTLMKGSKVDSNVSITTSGAELYIDATGMTAGEYNGITGTVTNSGNGTVAVINNDDLEAEIVDGKIMLVAIPKVAKIGDVEYRTLQAAVDAAQAGDVITVLENVVLEETVTVAADKVVTLDLNGKTISQVKAQTANYSMIQNDGDLTIVDNVGGGKISYTDSGNGGEYVSNTITNRGTLTVESGIIENLSSATVAANGYPYAIDSSIWGTADEVNTIVKGGKVYCASYSAIRMRVDSDTEPVNVTVTGGEIIGTIEVQNASSKAGVGHLEITGGKLSNSGTANVLFFFGSGVENNITVAISGGEFTGNITKKDNAKLDSNFIKGGTFSYNVSDFCAEHYICEANADGTYSVKPGPNYLENLTLVDGVFTADTVYAGKTVGKFRYERKIAKNWEAFYVPFEVSVSDLDSLGLEVAYINGVRRDDADYDGILDKFVMEVIYIHGGDNCDGTGKTLRAHYPYFVRSNSADTVKMVLEYEDITLTLPSDEQKKYDCTTFTEKFELVGTTKRITTSYFEDGRENKYGVLNGEWRSWGEKASMRPFRFYMAVTSRVNGKPIADIKSMAIAVRGEELPDGTTLIYDIEADREENDMIFDLQGRRVLETEKGRIYIKNGKKFIAQ